VSRNNGRRGKPLSPRASYLLKKWGLTEDQYEQILIRQDRRCFICRNHPNGKALAVDHDHITLRIRGLLCYRCNHFLVGRHRDPELIQRVADYLRQGTEHYAPAKKPRKKRKKNGKNSSRNTRYSRTLSTPQQKSRVARASNQ
jgi:hypothetical protein